MAKHFGCFVLLSFFNAVLLDALLFVPLRSSPLELLAKGEAVAHPPGINVGAARHQEQLEGEALNG